MYIHAGDLVYFGRTPTRQPGTARLCDLCAGAGSLQISAIYTRLRLINRVRIKEFNSKFHGYNKTYIHVCIG